MFAENDPRVQGAVYSAGSVGTNATALTFSNSNNVTFGLGTGSAAGVLTASVPNVTNSSLTISDAATSMSLARLAFTNSNGLTLSLSTGAGGSATVIGSYTVPTVTNSSWTVSDAATSATVGRLAFTNSNGLTLSLSTSNNGNHTVIGSYTVPTVTNSSMTVSDNATSGTLARLAFTNLNAVTLSLSTGAGGSHTIVGSVNTIAISLGGNTATTNSSVISLGTGYVLAGGANVTLQQSNNTISISAASAAAAPVNVSAGTTSQNIGSLIFANSNNVSFGIGTGGSSQSITASIQPNHVLSNSQAGYSTGTIGLSEGGGAITIATSAGGQSFVFSVPQTSSLSGIYGINISTNGSTISVVPPIMSYFAVRDCFIDDNSTTMSCGGSNLQVMPFVLPVAISGLYMRLPVSMSQVSTESAATTANSTISWNRTYSQAVVIYTQLSGASSLSLGSLTSTLASWVFQNSLGMNANGSRYTLTQNVTYPISGTTSQFTTSSAQSSANIGFSTNLLTGFTGLKWVDIPFGISLSPGNYWAGFGVSTNSGSNAGPAAMSGASMGLSTIGISHSNVQIGVPGAATNSSIHLMPGLGSWSTNSLVMSTASLQFASISMQSSHPLVYFQIARFA